MSDLDKSKPIKLNVVRRGDHVVFTFGGMSIGLEPDVAHTLAEKTLTIVGDIQGKSFILLTGSPAKPAHKRTKTT